MCAVEITESKMDNPRFDRAAILGEPLYIGRECIGRELAHEFIRIVLVEGA